MITRNTKPAMYQYGFRKFCKCNDLLCSTSRLVIRKLMELPFLCCGKQSVAPAHYARDLYCIRQSSQDSVCYSLVYG